MRLLSRLLILYEGQILKIKLCDPETIHAQYHEWGMKQIRILMKPHCQAK
jgi:hypothetical protein